MMIAWPKVTISEEQGGLWPCHWLPIETSGHALVIGRGKYVAQVRACLKSGRWGSFWQERHSPP